MNKKSKAESKEKKPKNSAEDVKLSRVFYHYWKFARKYKTQYLILAITLILASLFLRTINYYFFKNVIDGLVNKDSISVIWKLFLLVIFSSFLANILFRIADYLAVKYYMKVIVNLHEYTFNKIIKHSVAFFENNFTGALVNKISKFVSAYETMLDNILYNFLSTSGQVIFILIILFFINFKIALIFLFWTIFYIFISFLFSKKMLIIDYNQALKTTKRVGVLSDVITNILNLKIFSANKNEFKNYRKVTNISAKATLRSWYWGNYQWAVQGLLFMILEFVTIGYALKLYEVGEFSVGDIVLVQSYYSMLFMYLWNVAKAFRNFLLGISDAKEMVSILDQPVEVQDIKNAKKLKVEKGEIVFKDTTFSYPNQKENVFHKFNLKIPAGQTVGLVGTSGAGKTTITKLLLRFSNLKSGKILIDHQNISEVTQDSLRSSIAYVPQEPVLFHRSIYENIAYANPTATKEEVMEASQKAHVDEFVQTLENGYDTMVGERGVKLSGGQKQRVAVARAFLKNAPILVLDEATSALDSVSEEFIQDALFKLMKDKTVIVVAHRLSTIQRLDRILVIEDGIIEEDGNHESLLKKKGLYNEFWGRQTRKK